MVTSRSKTSIGATNQKGKGAYSLTEVLDKRQNDLLLEIS